MSDLAKRKCRAQFVSESRVFEQGRSREVILELQPSAPGTMTLRLKGRRTKFAVSFDEIYWYAMKKATTAAALERRRARKAGTM